MSQNTRVLVDGTKLVADAKVDYRCVQCNASKCDLVWIHGTETRSPGHYCIVCVRQLLLAPPVNEGLSETHSEQLNDLRAELDKWFRYLAACNPCFEDGDSMSIKFEGGCVAGQAEFEIVITKTSVGC